MNIFRQWLFVAVAATASLASASAENRLEKTGLKTQRAYSTEVCLSDKVNRSRAVVPVIGRKHAYSADAYSPFAHRRMRGAKAPSFYAAASADVPQLRGCVIYSENYSVKTNLGLYNLPSRSNDQFEPVATKFDANGGGAEVDGIFYSCNYFDFYDYTAVTIEGYDVTTGMMVCSYEGDIDNVCVDTATDPTTGTVYGITYTSDGQDLQLAKIQYTSTATTTTAIASVPSNWIALAIDKDGQMYAIERTTSESMGSTSCTSSSLLKVNKTDGTYTRVGSATGAFPYFMSSATIDPKTNRMFWAVCPDDLTGRLYEVNLYTGVAQEIMTFSGNEEIVALYVAPPAADDKAPASPENLAVNFEGSSLSGKISFDAPRNLFDGTAASGQLSYMIYDNYALKADGTAQYGEHIVREITVDNTGKHTFLIICSNDAGKSPAVKLSAFVGPGIPAAPTQVSLDVSDGKLILTWNQVDGSADGGYIDPSAITYRVKRYPGGETVADGLQGTSYQETVDETAPLTGYSFGVFAVSDKSISAEARSNTVTIGCATAPWTEDFSDKANFSAFTVIDSNNDGRIWQYTYDGARYTYSSIDDGDDWLISPPIRLQKGKAYELKFDSWCYDPSYTETFEVFIGRTPDVDGMGTRLSDPIDIENPIPSEFSYSIVPEEDGIYYIGWHCISMADMFYLYLGNISLTEGVATGAPGASQNFVCTPDASGALSADISFRTPAKDYLGNALGSIERVELYRNDVIIKTFESPATDASLSFTDTPEKAGLYEYKVIAFNEFGAGQSVSTSVFVGEDYPMKPENVTIRETSNDGEIAVEWSPVISDRNGKLLNQDFIRYALYKFDGNDLTLVERNLTGTSHTFVPQLSGQTFIQCLVAAVTSSGEGEGTVSDMIPVGMPYSGMDESFADGKMSYIFATETKHSEIAWQILDDSMDVQSQDGDNGYLGMRGTFPGDTGRLLSGKISLKSIRNPGLTFYTYCLRGDGTLDPNEVAVEVIEAGKEPVKVFDSAICDLTDREGWVKVTIPLDEFADKTVQIALLPTVRYYAYILFDNLHVGELVNCDLAVKNLSAPASVSPGSDYDVSVRVVNEGKLDVKNYNIRLFADGECVADETGELSAGTNRLHTFTLTMPRLATEDVVLRAEIICDGDENAGNNSTEEFSVSPALSSLPYVSDLIGSENDGCLTLSWSDPNPNAVIYEEITEDFESANSFSHEFENWIFIDRDQEPVGGFQELNIPNITPGSTLASFIVFDTTVSSDYFTAASGTKFIASMYRADDGTVDDWAISPLLSGESQTVSVSARSYSAQYPERMEILVSEGSTNPDDFVKVFEVTPPEQWMQYNITVPAGTKRFAIRSCGTAGFLLMVDDVKYMSEGENVTLELKGYNVWRNSELLTAEPLKANAFADAANVSGDYVVTTVWDRGESRASNKVSRTAELDAMRVSSLSISGCPGGVKITGVTDMTAVRVIRPDGIVVYSNSISNDTKIPLASGLYIVSAGTKTAKISVCAK